MASASRSNKKIKNIILEDSHANLACVLSIRAYFQISNLPNGALKFSTLGFFTTFPLITTSLILCTSTSILNRNEVRKLVSLAGVMVLCTAS